MTANKRWLSKVYGISQDSAKSNISWIISDSDDEDILDEPQPSAKKMKINRADSLPKGAKTWINVTNLHLTPSKDFDFENKENILLDNVSSTDEESPILKGLSERLKEESSVLNELYTIGSRESSPVISRRRNIYKKVKFRNRLEDNFKIEDETFNSQQSQTSSYIITDTCSQLTIDHDDSPANISPTKSEILSQSVEILPFPSQHSSLVVSADIFSSGGSDGKFPYHKRPPRKKKFKRGGLARQLQRAVNVEKASLGFWQHELEMGTLQYSSVCQENCFTFCVANMWTDYGCLVLECEMIKEEALSSKINSRFLIMVSPVCQMKFKQKKNYKMLMPFDTRTVMFRDQDTLCCFNACKFIAHK